MDGSPVRKTCWLLRLYGMIVNGCLAISYGDFGRNKAWFRGLGGKAGKGWEIKS